MKQQQLEKVNIIPPLPAEVPPAITPMAMLEKAVTSGASMEMLEKLVALSERWEANQARKAFDAAMAAAKAEIPVIIKNRTVDFTSQKGRTNYRHEDLAEIARTVDTILAKHGLSYRYQTASPIGEPVTVTCIVSHRDGHSETNTLCAGRDDSGNKNSIQAVGSAITYLQRYTLKAALGLAASNDDDGRSMAADSLLDDEQLRRLIELADEVGADKEKFCAFFKIEGMAQLPAKRFDEAVDLLNRRKKA